LLVGTGAFSVLGRANAKAASLTRFPIFRKNLAALIALAVGKQYPQAGLGR
jgi:hypothetical protein